MLRRLMAFFFLLFVFGSTFSISITQLSLGVCAVLFVIVAVRERFNPFGHGLGVFWTAVGLYVGWLVFVCLLQERPLHSLDNMREEWLFIIIPVGLYLGRERRMLDQTVGVLSIGLTLFSVATILMYVFRVQYHLGDGFAPLPEANPRASGTFVQALTYGNLVAVASLAVLTWVLTKVERWSWKHWAVLTAGGLGLVSILFCGGRGPALAGLVGLITLLLMTARTSRKWGFAILMAVLLIGVLTPSVRSRFTTELRYHLNADWPGGRLFIWERSLEMISDHPILGVGPGNFGPDYMKRLDPSVESKFWYSHAHNDFLEAAARSGIPGLVTFVLLWAALLYTLAKGWRQTVGDPEVRGRLAIAIVGSIAFLIASMTEATFSDEEVRTVLLLVWAIGLSAVYNFSETEPSRDVSVS